MKICLAQIKPVSGDVQYNLKRHEILIDLAIQAGAELVVFPELSLTGYEPTLAKELATTIQDERLDGLQKKSNDYQITICAGLPITIENGICIGMVILQPNMPRELYTKKFLHSDEVPFFVPRENKKIGITLNNTSIAFAICYELSVPSHSTNAFQSGADFYITSVAKTANGVDRATETLSEIAKKYSTLVMMSNSIGFCDGVVCAGKSSAWNRTGELIGQLSDVDEGVLVVNTDTLLVEKKVLSGESITN